MTQETFANTLVPNCVLTGAISSTATSCVVSVPANFPTLSAGQQFRMSMQDTPTSNIEIVIVTATASGGVFTITRGAEGSTASAHTAGASCAIAFTAALAELFYANLLTGVASPGAALDEISQSAVLGAQVYNRTAPGAYAPPQKLSNVIGTYGLYDFLGTQPEPFSVGIAQLQAWLLQAQLIFLSMSSGTEVLDDQSERVYIRCVLPAGDFAITCPLVIPRFVALECQGTLVRTGQSGTITNFYNGDVTSNALVNKIMPAVIVVPNAHVLGTLSVYCNSNGSDNGSGVAIGKNWWANTVTNVVAGTGYQVGDQIYTAQPDKAPAYPVVIQVTSVNGSGGITGSEVVNRGTYLLPPVLQETQWTAANGFTGGTAEQNIGQVFDVNNTGWFLTYNFNGHGTGAEFTVAWEPDFAGGGAPYSMGNNPVTDTLIENINCDSCGNILDATYGPSFGTIWGALNFDIIGVIACGGARIGAFLQGVADVHGGIFNPVNCYTGIKIAQGGSIKFHAIVDSAIHDCIEIDAASQVFIDGYAINFNQPSLTGLAALVIGGDTTYSGTSAKATGINVKMTMMGVGNTAGTTPSSYLDYMTGANCIDLTVSNKTAINTGIGLPSYVFAQFGSHNTSIGKITGSIDGATGAIFTGTVPNEGISVQDINLPGEAGPSGTYRIFGAGAPTNAVTGANKAGIGSTYIDTTNGHLYINSTVASSPTWNELT